jgi:LMBR1 domain-containing protein 1
MLFRKDGTTINSFLFNINLILITSVSVTQFCAKAFREYTTMTDIDLIFGTQIRYLKFFFYFYNYNIFEYAIFVNIINTFFNKNFLFKTLTIY